MTRRTRRDEHGAAAIEFALVAIPLLTILVGIVQYSMYFYSGQSGAAAAHEGARRAAVGDLTCSELVSQTDDKTQLKSSSSPGLVVTRTYYATGTSAPRPASQIQVGDDVEVVVQYNSVNLHLPLVPLPKGGVIREVAYARLENKTASSTPC